MPLESATHITDLNTANPVGSTDKVQTLDDHVRLIKTVLKTDLNLAGAVTASHTELNILDGATLSTAELNILDGATLSTAELNILDGVVLTPSQINDAARKSAANTFTAAQTIEHSSPEFVFHETDAAADNGWWSFVVAAEQLRGVAYNDLFVGNNWLVVDRSGNTIDQVALTATALSFSGAVLAPTVANSTSTTLVAGQLHFITGNATLPNLTAGQWIEVINDSASPIDISKHASDTAYWTASGASAGTFTLAARGRLSAVCNPAGSSVYVSGNITAAS